MIDTTRLKIYVASKEQMETFIELQTVDALKEAYMEMLDSCHSHQKQWEWYAICIIIGSYSQTSRKIMKRQ